VKSSDSIVFVVDDDLSVRQALASLIGSVGLRSETFASAQEFLQYERPDAAACLVLDVRLPGLSGLDLQAELAKTRKRIPIVFITGHGDIPMTVRAMKAGATEFLLKPFRDQELLDAIRQGLDRDQATRRQRAEVAEIKRDYDLLTSREREVLLLIAKGLLNKEVAASLGITEITIKVHRRHIMQKMKVRSFPQLVRTFEKLAVTGLAEERTYT
jgi:FixJ family two-component response regulator